MDQDLQARQEARTLCRRGREAQEQLKSFSQARLDRIVQAISRAFSAQAAALGRLAAEETGFGRAEDKEKKNLFASQTLWEAVKDMKTVGLLSRQPGLWEIGVPVGLLAAIVPSTNPTATVCYKAMIALKAGNPIVFSPHPKAVKCTLAAAELAAEAAKQAGAPPGSIGCLTKPMLAGTRELMTAPEVRLILATGGPAMVKAAYSSGKPAIGVGAGNGPAYLHRSADLRQALSCILESKTFDCGTVCASEQSILVEREQEEEVIQTARSLGFYLMNPNEAERLGRILFRPGGALNPEVVGKPAEKLSSLAGFPVPPGTQVLLARADRVGEKYPYSMEKLCPVLGFFVLDNEEAVLQKAVEILEFEGSGHTFSIHARDEAVISRFAEKIPVSRFLVNTPAALGGIGQTTRLFPALTLGCGAVGGSASSNNISPLELINIRRVAWGREAQQKAQPPELAEQITETILQRLHMQS